MERKITIEEDCIYKEDYQMKMLKENHMEGILDIRGRGVDNRSCYDYTVSGKVSMKVLYDKNLFTGKDIKSFLNQLIKAMLDVERHLLNIHCILLEPEYIFCDEGTYYFCYFPPCNRTVWEEFHKLTEYLVKQADYNDQEAVQIVGFLHKKTMADNYDLEEIIRECTVDEAEENTERQEHLDDDMYESGAYDWSKDREIGDSILKETDNLWLPVKKFLHRHRKPKWGDWDGLYIEEEEL